MTSVGITRVGDCDLAKLNAWFSKLLQERGVDIYRMKGVLRVPKISHLDLKFQRRYFKFGDK